MEMKGRIFSIEEFSVFDGDGVRETVFLKGCPLRCNWCHSPEGQNYDVQIVRSPNGCLGCGKCLDAGKKACGKRILTKESVEACPRNLVRVCGEDIESFDLAERILKNAAVLTNMGGGITFSGGEPLFQSDFLLETLKLLRGKINRAVQTTGYASSDKFKAMLEETELVLFDLKIMDDKLHRLYTGVGNEIIKRNFGILTKSGVKFITRVPLIPGVSDTSENLTALCGFLRENQAGYVELLPYNKFAGSKYKMCGRVYKPIFDENKEVKLHPEIFEKYGIKAVKL